MGYFYKYPDPLENKGKNFISRHFISPTLVDYLGAVQKKDFSMGHRPAKRP